MICPACSNEFKRRSGESCPSCGEELLLHAGYAFRASDGSPPQRVVVEFEKLLSQQISARQRMHVPFRFPRKSSAYKLELAQAERFLQQVDYDLDLVLRTLDVLFTNKQFSFKTRSSMLQLVRDFPVATAIATAIRARASEAQNRQNEMLQDVLSRPDIFAP